MAADPQGDADPGVLPARGDSASAKADEAAPDQAGPELVQNADVARLRAFFELLDRWDRGEQDGS